MSDFISVYMTVSTMEEASKIAEALVHERLAACVNILPSMRAVYRWKGEVKHENEITLILKTRMVKFEGIKKLMKLLHSHECPCIVATPITAGHQAYLDWIKAETP